MCSKVKKIRILLAAVLVALLPVLSCERLPEVDPAGVPGDEPEEQGKQRENAFFIGKSRFNLSSAKLVLLSAAEEAFDPAE